MKYILLFKFEYILLFLNFEYILLVGMKYILLLFIYSPTLDKEKIVKIYQFGDESIYDFYRRKYILSYLI
jgi:hypothetical protein